MDFEPFLVGGLVVVVWAGTCGGGPEVGGDEEGVALAVGLAEDEAVEMPPVASVAAREELEGETNGADRFVAGGVGVAPWAGVLAGVSGLLRWSVRGWLLGKFGQTLVAAGWCGTALSS